MLVSLTANNAILIQSVLCRAIFQFLIDLSETPLGKRRDLRQRGTTFIYALCTYLLVAAA
eukprot:gene2119-1295_t